MKRFTMIVLAAGLAMMLGLSSGVAQETVVGRSGKMIPAQKTSIDATIFLLDTGSFETGLVVNGSGSGFDPANTYVTLIYDPGAVAEGPNACSPTSSILDPTQMLVGFWKVDRSGRGRLFAVKSGRSYAPLSDIGTISIRVVLGPAPAGFVLQTCARVETTLSFLPDDR